MKAPTSLKIGPFDFSIEWMQTGVEMEKRNFGEFMSIDQVIRIAMHHKRQRVATSFFHEVNHGLWFVYGTGQDAKEEEDFVSALSFGMVAFIRDNPDAIAWAMSLLMERPGDPYMKSEVAE